MSLAALQAELAQAILKNEIVEGIHPQSNLAIYKNNIQHTLTEALFDTYPLIVKLVGADYFKLLAKEYIKEYPSRSGNLNDYGVYFADFLSRHPGLKQLIYLSEVADFEWICHTLYFAADAVQDHSLGNVSETNYPNLCASLHPASQLRHFHYPILEIIELCEGRQDDVNLKQGGVYLLLVRDTAIKLIILSEAEFYFLSTLQQGESLGIALQQAQRCDAQFNLEEKLIAWFKDKLIIQFYEKES